MTLYRCTGVHERSSVVRQTWHCIVVQPYPNGLVSFSRHDTVSLYRCVQTVWCRLTDMTLYRCTGVHKRSRVVRQTWHCIVVQVYTNGLVSFDRHDTVSLYRCAQTVWCRWTDNWRRATLSGCTERNPVCHSSQPTGTTSTQHSTTTAVASTIGQWR